VLGAAFITTGFMPSCMSQRWLGLSAFAFGATIAMRREVLASIGGFMPIAEQLGMTTGWAS